MVEAGANAGAVALDSDSALHLACQAEDGAAKVAMLRLLLSDPRGEATVNRQGFRGLASSFAQTLLHNRHWMHPGSTPLLRCVVSGVRKGGDAEAEGEAVGLLLAAGADPNVRFPDDDMALHMAAQNGAAPVIRRLLEAGARIDTFGSFARLASVGLPSSGRMPRFRGSTALMRAAAGGHEEAASVLIKAGASVGLAGPGDGDTALHQAAQNGHNRLGFLLLAAGAPPMSFDFVISR